MTVRIATCRCGQLSATCIGVPVRVSICHCLECQKRSGSAFAAQIRWPSDQVKIEGDAACWERISDGGRKVTYKFCRNCGSTISYQVVGSPDVTAVPYGAFAGQNLPDPEFSVFEDRKHDWVAITVDVARSNAPKR